MQQPLQWKATTPALNQEKQDTAKKLEKLEKKLLHYLGRAIADYALIKKMIVF